MHESDDFDPLDDLLLSDEELPKPKLTTSKPQVTFQNVHELEYDTETQKEKKKKIIADLFSSDEDKKEDEKLIQPKKIDKSNWLDLKDDDEEANMKFNTAEDHLSLRFKLSSKDQDGIFKDKKSDFLNNINSTDRRRSESKLVSLPETKKRFKSLDLDLFNLDAEPTSRPPILHDKNEKPTPEEYGKDNQKTESISSNDVQRDMTDSKRPNTSYVPSTGENRRFRASSSKRNVHEQKDWISILSLDDKEKKTEEKKIDILPHWLGNKDISTMNVIKNETHFSDSTTNELIPSNSILFSMSETIQKPKTNLFEKSNKPNTEEEIMEEDEIVGEDENMTNAVAKLKKKKEKLKELDQNQTEYQTKYEQEVYETAVQLMKKRTNIMKALLQLITFEGYHLKTSEFTNTSCLEDQELLDSKNTIIELKLKTFQHELEKCELELKIKHMERKHTIDLSMLEDCYKYKLQMAEEKEEYYKNEMQIVEEEYIQKLLKRKEEEIQLIQSYNEKLKSLKEEHAYEIKHMAEMNNLRYPWKQLYLEKNNSNVEALSDKELVLRELAVQDKQKELLEFEERLSRQRLSLETREATLNTKVEDFELKTTKEKLQIEQQKKEIKLTQNIFEEKQSHWQREQQREKDHLSNEKAELEMMKEELLKHEGKLTKEKFEVKSERARLEAIINAEGNAGQQTNDFLHTKAELHGTIDELRRLKSKLETERDEIKHEDLRLKEEGWRLREVEQHLRLQQKNMEKLVEESEAKREEGLQALRKAQKIENEISERMEEIEKRALELKRKEDILIQEKIELSKERDLLTKRRYQLDMVLPQLTYDEQLPFNLLTKGIVDPKLMMAKFNLPN